jgi:phage recombination protein Bet
MSQNTALATLTSQLATRLNIGASDSLIETLKATAFRGQVSDEQMTALIVVANQYGLNPWTKEIYAYPGQTGIVPVVGVDGWARIINNHPEFDGMEFEMDAESCTCIMYRKDRSRPIKITEYLNECSTNAKPWQTHPRRMLRHKAMIQCARLAFGFGGIYDKDEAERIVETIDSSTGEIRQVSRKEMPAYPQADLERNLEQWAKLVQSGRKTPDEIIAIVGQKGVLSEEQKRAIHALAIIDVAEKPAPAMELQQPTFPPTVDPWVEEYDRQ